MSNTDPTKNTTQKTKKMSNTDPTKKHNTENLKDEQHGLHHKLGVSGVSILSVVTIFL
jgi:hypothetical protein